MASSLFLSCLLLAFASAGSFAQSCSSYSGDVQAICQKAVDQGLDTFPLANAVQNLKSKLDVTFASPAQTSTQCGIPWTTTASTFSMNGDMNQPPQTTADTYTANGVEAQVSWDCDPAKQYTLIMFDAGKHCYDFQGNLFWSGCYAAPGFGFLHWTKINIQCGANGRANSTGGELYAPQTGAVGMSFYASPANPDIVPHAYQFFVYEQTSSGIVIDNSTAYQFAAQQGQFDIASFVQTGFGTGALNLTGPVAYNWAHLQVSPASVALFTRWNFANFVPFACTNLAGAAMYNAAFAQGIATSILGTGVSYLNRAFSLQFDNGAPFNITNPCDNSTATIPRLPRTVTAATSNETLPTTDTITPIVATFPCYDLNDKYTVIIYDSAASFIHGLYYNVKCVNTSGGYVADILGATPWTGVFLDQSPSNFTFVPPGNPNPSRNNYGWYAFQQQQSTDWNPTLQEQALVPILGFNFTSFVLKYETMLGKGPVARTWHYGTLSIASPWLLNQAKCCTALFVQLACNNLQASATTGVPVAATTTIMTGMTGSNGNGDDSSACVNASTNAVMIAMLAALLLLRPSLLA